MCLCVKNQDYSILDKTCLWWFGIKTCCFVLILVRQRGNIFCKHCPGVGKEGNSLSFKNILLFIFFTMKSTFIKSNQNRYLAVINERTFKISVFHQRNSPPSFHSLILLGGFFYMKVFPKDISAFSLNFNNF